MVTAGLIAAGIGLGGKLYNSYQANKSEKEANNKLKDLQNEALPQFGADPTLLNYYTRNLSNVNNPQGLSEGEKNAYNQNVTNATNTAINNATGVSGGNLSKYISNSYNPSIVSGQNQLVGQDARLKQSNYNTAMGHVGTAVNAFQGMKDRNTQNAWTRRMMIEQALGNSVLQNKKIQTDTVDSLSNTALGLGGNLIGGNMGGAKVAGTPPTAGNMVSGVTNPYEETFTTPQATQTPYGQPDNFVDYENTRKANQRNYLWGNPIR